jgi:hypothetical protein
VFWVISVYFNIRNTLPKFGTFLLGHPVFSKYGMGKTEVVKKWVWPYLRYYVRGGAVERRGAKQQESQQ